MFLYSLTLESMRLASRNVGPLPSSQWTRKDHNDRFALCTGGAIPIYGLRSSEVGSNFRDVCTPLHSELLLKYALSRSLCFVRPFGHAAARIRIGGRVVTEKFLPVSGSRLFIYWVREFCNPIVFGC